jgi:hypothetical protein
MNTIDGLKLDRTLTENELEIQRLRGELQRTRAYATKLEAALLSAPLFRPAGSTPQELEYEWRKRRWVETHNLTLQMAAFSPEKERERYKSKVKAITRTVLSNADTLARQWDAGDRTVRVPSHREVQSEIARRLGKL